METLSYFARYLVPCLISFVAVGAVLLLNRFIGPWIWAGRLAESIEIFAYTLRTTGPIIFGLTFIAAYYGVEALKEGWVFAKTICLTSLALLVVTLILNLVFLPKIR